MPSPEKKSGPKDIKDVIEALASNPLTFTKSFTAHKVNGKLTRRLLQTRALRFLWRNLAPNSLKTKFKLHVELDGGIVIWIRPDEAKEKV